MPPTVFSYSRLRSVDQCELNYCTRYVDRKYSKLESVERFVGTVVHKVVEEDHQGKLPSGPIAAWERVSQLWDQEYRADRVFDVRENGPDYWRGHAMSCISNYMRLGKPYGTVLGVEFKLGAPLLDEPITTVIGIMDRWLLLDGCLEIHDFKTGKMPRGGHREFLADNQLPLYAALAAHDRGMPDTEEILVKRIYLGPGKEAGYAVTGARRAEAMAWARKQAVKCRAVEEAYVATRVAEGTKGILCKWCSYYHDGCPAWLSSPI